HKTVISEIVVYHSGIKLRPRVIVKAQHFGDLVLEVVSLRLPAFVEPFVILSPDNSRADNKRQNNDRKRCQMFSHEQSHFHLMKCDSTLGIRANLIEPKILKVTTPLLNADQRVH